jgi:hypothetical protein|tara:strand:+ start:590 stop:766 length:177 start_codon:yes stop_codon:yes gene_type:complete
MAITGQHDLILATKARAREQERALRCIEILAVVADMTPEELMDRIEEEEESTTLADEE